ncbi:MAG TPA: GAF domain-containing protein [Candidatus Angelobacter sp.]|nr:GAF domain-containing protein [Candidatus Angelobacter sp.]
MDLTLQSAFFAEMSTLLILLAGAVLLYSSFREKYLIPWIAGWTCLSLAKVLLAVELGHASLLWASLSLACFILGLGLLVAAVLVYVSQRKLLLPLFLMLAAALTLALVYTLWLPYPALRLMAQGLCWTAKILASIQLVRFAWGRRAAGRWLLAAMFLLLHLDVAQNKHSLMAYDFLVDLSLGIGMMTVVLEDARAQIQRLDALNTITHQVSDSREFESIIGTILEELRKITRAKAAWFRMLQGEKLVLAGHCGLSRTFAQKTDAIDTGSSVSGFALREGEVYVLKATESHPNFRETIIAEGIHHLLLVPIEGKNAPIGMFVLGMAHFRAYTGREKKFLKAAAKQIGLAAENRILLQQVVHSRNEWASTFDSIPDYILVHDLDYRILRANSALLGRLQRTRKDVVNSLCEEILPGAATNWKGCPYCAHADCGGEEDPCFGGYSVVSTSPYTGENQSRAGTVHVIKDITEAKAAEERFTSLFNHMHEGVFVSTPDGKILDCNEAFVRMLGYDSKEDILKLDVAQSVYVDTEDRNKFLSEIARQGFVRNFEILLRCKDGRKIHVIESSVATRAPSGQIERYQGVVLDVTEMKRAEDEIRRRNRELYVLNNIAVTFNQSFDLDEILQLIMLQMVELFSTDTAAVYLFDEETNTLARKASYGHRTTWAVESESVLLPAEFIASIKANHAEIIDQEQLPRLPQVLQRAVELEGLRSWLWVVLWRKEKILGVLATSSRTPREFSRSEQGVMIAVGRQLATTIEKVQLYNETRQAYEDLRRTQEQLLQSEKMSAVGQLISGVAHELNNPLTAILGYTQLLESEKLEPRIEEFIQKLRKQAQRTQRIVQNLLSFARQHKPARVHVDLRSVVEDTIALRDYDLKVNNIEVVRDFGAVLPSVVADPHQLEQVYLNIINNAADAMMDSGRGGRLRISIAADNGSVVTSFHDSGPGIYDPKHVFDPFYTTKGVGKGTGLGLSICYGIVKEHGGEISAQNHPDGGALLQVRLPVAVGEKPISERDRIVARRESRLEGNVLLVDDEEAVLDFEREVLTAAGLNVVTVSSGAEAVDCLKQEDFDVLLLDSKIPGIWSSEEVFHWIEQNRPELVPRTVCVLSNVSDARVRAFVDATRIFCLVKPFEVSDLLAVARRVLRRVKVASHSH